jgi:hypothetical protein
MGVVVFNNAKKKTGIVVRKSFLETRKEFKSDAPKLELHSIPVEKDLALKEKEERAKLEAQAKAMKEKEANKIKLKKKAQAVEEKKPE